MQGVIKYTKLREFWGVCGQKKAHQNDELFAKKRVTAFSNCH